jgi:nucleoid DNA-binding protein
MSHIAPISMRANATIAAYRIVTALTGTANTVKVPASKAVKFSVAKALKEAVK